MAVDPMTPDAAEIKTALADVLAAHYYFALEPGRCHGCGERLSDGADIADWHRTHQVAMLLPLVTQAQAEAWPCDDYEAPLTCYTVPNGPKHLTCGGCRAAFPRGPEVQRLYRARADERGT